MALALEGLGLVLGVITSIPVLSDLFQDKPDLSTTTKVRLIVGDNDGTEGNVPHLSLFDVHGQNIGFTSEFKQFGDVAEKGQPIDVDVVQIDPSRSANGAEYIALSASEGNAICISVMTVTTPTGVKYNFLGDIFAQCDGAFPDMGFRHYPGNVIASSSAQGEFRPSCFWIDGDNTNGIKMGVGIHLPSFMANADRQGDFRDNPARMCQSTPRLGYYDQLTFLDSVPYFKDPVFDPSTLLDIDDKALDQGNWDQIPVDVDQLFGFRRRSTDANETAEASLGPRQIRNKNGNSASRGGRGQKNRLGNQKGKGSANTKGGNKRKPWDQPGLLNVTPHASHNITAVCNSRGSLGPDIVNPVQGKYCHMKTKTLWDVCENEAQNSCFDMDTKKMRLGPQNSKRDLKSGQNIPEILYTTVSEWK